MKDRGTAGFSGMVSVALAGVVLAGCTSISLDSPDWPPAHGRAAPAPVVTRTPVPVGQRTTPAPLPAPVPAQEDAGVVVTPVVPSALEAESGALSAPARASAGIADEGWAGHYTGMLPCADCEGIRALLTLQKDSTYVLSLTYVGRNTLPLMMRGNFTWNADETQIQLDANGGQRRYQIGNGEARMLTRDGAPITGVLASSYVLKKRPRSD